MCLCELISQVQVILLAVVAEVSPDWLVLIHW